MVTAGPLEGFLGHVVQHLGTKYRISLDGVDRRILAEIDEGFVEPTG